MVALHTYLLVIIIGVSSGSDTFEPQSLCSIENARFLPIYDLTSTTLNVLVYDDILESVLGYKFYQFDDVEKKAVGGMFYGSYPVLVVYQPDENISELHGYYFPYPWGLQHIYDTDRFSSQMFANSQTFRDFLNSPVDKEGYTPSAALQMYPEVKNYNLTKIIDNTDKQGPVSGCAVLFVFPKKNNHETNEFVEKYNVFEEYYYNSSTICKADDFKADEDDYDTEDGYAVIDENIPPWTVFGHKGNAGDDKGYNLIDFDQVNQFYSKYGYYQFKRFDKGYSNYSKNPTLVVMQPDEKVPELHGYYFSRGIQSLTSYMLDPNDDEVSFNNYKPFFDYILKEVNLDGLTPDAALYDYPYFFDYVLTKLIHAGDVAEQFAIVFLAPSRYRPANFGEKYYAIEDFSVGIKGIVKKTNYKKVYLQDDTKFGLVGNPSYQENNWKKKINTVMEYLSYFILTS